MNKNKIFTIISLAFCIILIAVASFSRSSAQITAPTVSGGGSYSYSESYIVTCSYGDPLFYNGLGHAYANWYCDNGTSGGWQCSNQPIPGNGSTAYRTVSGTHGYSCTYLSAVTSWSDCSNGTQSALDGTYTTISGSSCTNVETTRACPAAPTLTSTPGSCGGKTNLSWTAVTGASGYKLYNKDNSLLLSTTNLSYNNFLASTSDSFTIKATVGGGDSAPSTAIFAVPSSPCLPLSATCTATPSTTMVDQNVTWRAIPAGGSAPYTYSWIGNNYLNNQAWTAGNVNTVTKTYTTVGYQYATTTVVSGSETVTVGCPLSVASSGGGGGGGVDITPRAPIAGICGGASGSVFANASELTNSPVRCYLTGSTSSPATFTGFGPWSWTCSGVNGSAVSSPDCTAYQSEIVNTAYDCNTLTANRTSPVNVNNNIKWTATPKVAGNYATKWAFTDSNNPTQVYITDSNPWDKIFTTTGLKTVYVKFASSTAPNVVGNPCTATTTVVQTGGGINEI